MKPHTKVRFLNLQAGLDQIHERWTEDLQQSEATALFILLIGTRQFPIQSMYFFFAFGPHGPLGLFRRDCATLHQR